MKEGCGVKQNCFSPSCGQVRLTGGFLKQYQQLIREKTMPYQWEVLNDHAEGVEKSGALENFKIAAGESKQGYYGTCFQDSDVGKWLECVAYLLANQPDAEWESRADEVIALLGRAQQHDGYLNTYFTVAEPGKRFTNIRECDELYCFGHLAEAAVAYAQSTGKKELLQIICRYADLICRVFGTGEGQIPACDGHPESELAFVRLYEATGEPKYLEQAGFELHIRGTEPYYYDIEWERRGKKSFHPHLQNEKPSDDKGYDQSLCSPQNLRAPVGHAVKMGYLLAGMAAYCQYAEEPTMWEACQRVFESIQKAQVYITGAVGSTRHKEAFTAPYHLPNDRAYAETCASAALIFAMRRMLNNHPNAAYADMMERSLYNGLLAGISHDGTHFFYVNPLESYPNEIAVDPDYQAVKPVRQPWFGCACCPPNLARTVANIGEYLYTVQGDKVYVQLYAASEASFTLGNGLEITIHQFTDYPWNGTVQLEAECTGEYTLLLRWPEWCEHVSLRINDQEIPVRERSSDGYLSLGRRSGKIKVEYEMLMEACFMEADPAVRADAGKVAVQRGPVIYCAEECDNGPQLFRLAVNPQSPILIEEKGCFDAPALKVLYAWREGEDSGALYRRYHPSAKKTSVHLVPYCLWGNRDLEGNAGEMTVWLRRREN